MMEVHDCFSITELCTMEDLRISPDGQGAATTSWTASTTWTGRSRASRTAG